MVRSATVNQKRVCKHQLWERDECPLTNKKGDECQVNEEMVQQHDVKRDNINIQQS